jgi:glycosyltransferase involved in cell wall biosynthesis
LARLEELVTDEALRRRMGQEGRRRVEEVYALNVQQIRFAQLLQTLVEEDG